MREHYSLQLAVTTGVVVLVVTVLFAVLQSPEILSAPVRSGMAMPHPVEGYRHCDTCHGYAGTRPYPIGHWGWSNQSCVSCHAPTIHAGQPPVPPPADRKASALPHPIKGYEACTTCHDPKKGSRPVPSDHRGWGNEICGGCHPSGG